MNVPAYTLKSKVLDFGKYYHIWTIQASAIVAAVVDSSIGLQLSSMFWTKTSICQKGRGRGWYDA